MVGVRRVRPAPTVDWVDPVRGRTLELDALEGAVWEVVDGHGEEVAVQWLRWMGGLAGPEGEAWVARRVDAWIEEGWLVQAP
jgi:hypothetical protein